MKTTKKASVKAQAFCSKLEGTDVAKSTTWETCTDIIGDHFDYVYDVLSTSSANGDTTSIKIYKKISETGTELLETISIPNSEAFDKAAGDWDWPTIYKLVTEYFIKNWKVLAKGKKKSSKKKKQTPVIEDVSVRLAELKTLIKAAKGAEKKKLIKEFNEKSKLLES